VVAARQGIAYALCAEPQVREAIARGELIRLDPRGLSRQLDLHRRDNAPRVLDAAVAEILALARRTLSPPHRRSHEKPTISP
jgi:hypothetical protein